MENKHKLYLGIGVFILVVIISLFYIKSSAEKSFKREAPEWIDYNRVSYNPLTGNFTLDQVELGLINMLDRSSKPLEINRLTFSYSSDMDDIYILAEGVKDYYPLFFKLVTDYESGSISKYFNYLDIEEASTDLLELRIARSIDDNEAEMEMELVLDGVMTVKYQLELRRINKLFKNFSKLMDIDMEDLMSSINYDGYRRTMETSVFKSLGTSLGKVKLVKGELVSEDLGYFSYLAAYKNKVASSLTPTTQEVGGLGDCLERKKDRQYGDALCSFYSAASSRLVVEMSPRKKASLIEYLLKISLDSSNKELKKYGISIYN